MNDFSGTLGTGALVEWLESNIGLPFSCQFIWREVRLGRIKERRKNGVLYFFSSDIREWFDLWKSEENDLPHDILLEAYREYGKAKRLGKISRGLCEVCGDPTTDGHHENYRRPLDVRWLCRIHHCRYHWALDTGKADSIDQYVSEAKATELQLAEGF